MYKVGNQVILKKNNKEGFIYSVLGDNHYAVGIKENGMLKVQVFPAAELTIKACEFGTAGICDHIANSASEGQFACIDCKLKRMTLNCENI